MGVKVENWVSVGVQKCPGVQVPSGCMRESARNMSRCAGVVLRCAGVVPRRAGVVPRCAGVVPRHSGDMWVRGCAQCIGVWLRGPGGTRVPRCVSVGVCIRR